VIERVMNVTTIQRVPFATALSDGRVIYCQQQADAGYQAAVVQLARGRQRKLKILYSPMHGVGNTSVVPVLLSAGFNDLEVFALHATPDGAFPNVPGHVANPENPQTFDAIIERAKISGADVILSTDPDADRLGCAAPLTPGGPWKTFTGNQIGALLTEYLLDSLRQSGQLRPEQYLVKTLVTTDLIKRLGDSYGVRTFGNLLVGFKWIAGIVDEAGPEQFILGLEESHGYLAGTYARDKDAAAAALLLAELAAQLKTQNKTLHQKLDDIFWQHGCHLERTVSLTMPGSEGMQRMQALMALLRSAPPSQLGGIKVRQIRDYEQQQVRYADGSLQPLDGPPGDLVIFDLVAEGNYVAVRPSGTEPKVKIYLFAFEPPEQLANLEDAKAELDRRLTSFQQDLSALADQVKT